MNHTFDIDIAKEYGVHSAVIFQNFCYWCEHNRANGTHFYDGFYWTYNSIKAMEDLFPYMSRKQINSAVQKLIDDGLIIKGHYSIDKYDRTTWYAVTKKGDCIFRRGKMEEPKRRNGNSPEGKSTITDINSNINPNITTINNDTADVKTDTVEAYARANLMYLSPTHMQELASFMDDMEPELIRYAVDKACENGKRTWAYTKAILNGLLNDGIKTVGEAKAADDARRKKNTPPSMPQTDTDMSFEALY